MFADEICNAGRKRFGSRMKDTVNTVLNMFISRRLEAVSDGHVQVVVGDILSSFREISGL